MAVKIPYPTIWDDQEFYPLHEEDDVPEKPPHRRQVTYLDNALSARFPDWFVTSNVCIYWEPGNTREYVAPDLFVVTEPLPEPIENSYLLWKHPRIALVVEIGSKSSIRKDEGPKLDIYAENVHAAGYLRSNPAKGEQRLWRLEPDGYEPVAPQANGRLRSLDLGVEFGLDENGFLRVYTFDGEMLLTHEETEHGRLEEAERRQAAEAQTQEEMRLRQEAETRALEETARREELERQLAELRAQLEGRSL